MSASRQAILDRLAAVTGDPSAAPAPAGPLPAVVQPLRPAKTALLDRFTHALDQLAVTWELADTPITARLKLITALQAQGVRRILSWSADNLPVGGVLEALDVLGVAAITPDLRLQDPALRSELLAEIETISVGITGVDAAIAATGTLFLSAGPGRPLIVSQLPRQHMVLLTVSRILPTLEDGLATRQQPPYAGLVTALTGVSRTRDIELHASAGIHGPQRRHVIIVQDL